MTVPELTQPVPEPVVSTGRILAEKREEWDLTISEVAASLNLGNDTIEDIEADRFENLPGSTFVKGYVRAYARLLKLDPDSLLDNIDLQPERITEIPSTKAALKQKGKTRYRERKKSGGGRFFKWLFALIVVVGLAALGISQLPKLGIENVSDLLTLPGSQSEEASSNELLIPESTNSTTPGSANDSADGGNGNREALIRIE